jgi:TP901 family phage tail tape measure protein
MLLEAGDRVTGPLRSIAGGSTQAARALRLTREALAGITKSQADIAGFRTLKNALRTTGTDLTAARARAAALGRGLSETATPTRAMTRDFARARAEVQKLERQQQAETRQLGELRGRLREAGIATTDLARHERELRGAAERTTQTMEEQERRVARLADRHRRFAAGRERFDRINNRAAGIAASGAAAIGTGIAMAAPLLASVKAAQQYESVMTDIGQKAGLSRIHSAALGVELLKASRAANQMPADLQAGVDALAGLGATVPNAVAMMTPIGRAATAYKAEIADLSAAAYAATDNLKVPVDQTAKIIDVMASAGKAGAFEIKDMAQYFPSLTAAYQGLGQSGVGSVADLAAGLQIARKGAGDAASAGTNLANVIQKIASPATNKAFEKMGVDLPAALKKAYAEGKTPLEAIAEITNKTLKGDLSKLGYLFEDAQVQQGLRPLIQNMELFRKIRAEAAGASGTTDTDFAERMKDSAEASKQLKVNATALAVTLGAKLLPIVSAVVGKATAFATWIGDVAERYPGLTKAVMIGAAAFAGLFLVVGGGAAVIAGLVAPFAALAFASTALGIGMLPLLGIVAGVVIGIVALGAAAYLIYRNWGAIGAWFTGIWSEIKAGAAGGIAGIAGLIINFNPVGLMWRGLAGLLSLFGVQMPARLTDAGKMMMRGLVNGIMAGMKWVLSTVTGLADRASTAFRRALGIRSPSRVFMGFGGHIVDGLTNGIAAQEGEPVKRMEGLSSRLSKAIVTGSALPVMAMAAPAGAAPAGQGGAGGSRYEIHIHQQPGQSPQDLARAIADELDRRERDAAARARGTMADRPEWEDG